MLEVTELNPEHTDAGDGATWAGTSKLYELSEEVTVIPVVPGLPMTQTKHIIVSAIEFIPEGGFTKVQQTYIFPCDENGFPKNMGHVRGSIDGRLDHKRAIMNFISQHMKMEETDGCN